jgi:hypothetical protein
MGWHPPKNTKKRELSVYMGSAGRPDPVRLEPGLRGLNRRRHRTPAIERHDLETARYVALGDVRFEAHYGLKSDIAPCPKCAKKRRYQCVLTTSAKS